MPAFTIPSFAWPIVIDATNGNIRINAGGGDVTATIPAGTYFWRGDASANDMAAVVSAAMLAASASAFIWSLLSDGTVSIACAATSEINWADALTTADPAVFGFDAVNEGPLDDIYGDFQVGRSWFPESERIHDSRDEPRYEASQQRMADGSVDTQEWADHFIRDVLLDRLMPCKIFQSEETVGQEQEAWRQGVGGEERPSLWWACGERLEYCPDFASRAGALTNPGTRTTYKPRADLEEPNIVITAGTVDRYDVLLRMQYYVA